VLSSNLPQEIKTLEINESLAEEIRNQERGHQQRPDKEHEQTAGETEL
jgi:hypothetical protein